MQKQLSEREKRTLNELLQVNILSNNQDRLTRQKPGSLKFLTDNLNNNNDDKNISYNNRKSPLTSTAFFQKNRKNNRTQKVLSLKPKRLVKLYGGEIPLKFLGKATLDYPKTFYTRDHDEFERKINSTGKKSKGPNSIENEIVNINEETEFKASSGIKFAQHSNNFYKLKKNIDLISENRKRSYENLFNKLVKLFDIQAKLFFTEEFEENNYFSKTTSTFNTLSSQKMSTLNYKNISEEKSNSANSSKIKKIISVCFEIGVSMYKFLILILTELREKKDENIKLFKKSNEMEIRNNQIAKEFETLQKYHNRYDVNSKIYLQQCRENTIKNIKEKFNRKENEYIMNIYKLEEEIRNLTVLLNKNKEYYNKLKETEKEVEKSKRKNEEMKFYFNKELQEKIIQNANEKDREEELSNKVQDLEDIIDQLKKEQEDNKRKEIENNAKVKKIKMIVNEKNENILMINEELEWFRREYDKERFNHNNTKVALQILESRIFKDDEKPSEEKVKKEEKEANKNNTVNKKDKNADKKKEENKGDIKLNLILSSESND
jgi:hypothetical protein